MMGTLSIVSTLGGLAAFFYHVAKAVQAAGDKWTSCRNEHD